MERWTTAQINSQSGRSFVVTGANSGLGFETARQLAVHGARVTLTCRSDAKGRAAVDRIRAESPGALVEFRVLDLADLDSVRAFAAAVTSDPITVDVLVNNAGVMFPPRALTRQGFESQFATNHLGHFALTALLFDTICRGGDARVVTVSSLEHKRGSIHFDDLTGERSYSPRGFYQHPNSPTCCSASSWTVGCGRPGSRSARCSSTPGGRARTCRRALRPAR
jgi:NAD(P)-dependent dehydrogenase (short-subunit alcohol dehydrogenase family)